jgi:hypothetical protein
VSNSSDPPSRPPRFEELRDRAERTLAETLALLAELRATLEEVRHRWRQVRTRASQEEHGE